ncbi:hypothetical protein ACIPK7_06425 [Pseudomonas sp. NPDC086581]|uniref:hypothetical protein n=1 Tax=Pseudomonas sp. NPDC086581 TaxID=3364432 RepID=UPI0037FEED50
MILLAFCLVQKQITMTAISEKSGELVLAVALRVGHLQCLLLMRVVLNFSVATSPTSRNSRGSCIAEPLDGIQTMTTTEQVMTTLVTIVEPPSASARQCTDQELAHATARELLIAQRFICTFDSSDRITLTQLPAGPLYHPADIPAAIAAGALPRDLLQDIFAAASARLGIPGSEP